MSGYSSTPLSKKLGLKAHTAIALVKAPVEYLSWVSPLPEGIAVTNRLSGKLDFVHVFTDSRTEFEVSFLKAKKCLRKDAMLWISWPKKASKVPTDLDENIIREFGLANQLVDVKVCAVSEVWSGLKFVFRVKDR